MPRAKTRVVIETEAAAEVEAAFLWYRQRSQRAASSFRAEFSRTVDRIRRQPAAWPLFEEGSRRCAMRRFPYYIVYHRVDDALEIIAVAHSKRRPGYWRERSSDSD